MNSKFLYLLNCEILLGLLVKKLSTQIMWFCSIISFFIKLVHINPEPPTIKIFFIFLTYQGIMEK